MGHVVHKTKVYPLLRSQDGAVVEMLCLLIESGHVGAPTG